MLHNVEPGVYAAEIVCRTPPLWVESARAGTTDLMRENLVIVPGSESQPIEVVLRDDGASLTATVNAGAGESPLGLSGGGTASDNAEVQATVIAVSDRDPSRAIRSTHGGTNHQFQFSVLAPGKYRVFAFDSIDGLGLDDPNALQNDALQEFSSNAVQVSLEPNDNRVISLELITRGGP